MFTVAPDLSNTEIIITSVSETEVTFTFHQPNFTDGQYYSYSVQYSEDGGETFIEYTTLVHNSSLDLVMTKIKELQPDTTYDVQVVPYRTVNGNTGEGLATNASSFTTGNF